MADIAGLFAAPEDIQRARILQEAQLTPNQRLYMMGAKTGQAVGQGLGTLFGVDVQDPAMARASKLRELGAKYGTTTAEALDKIAADLQQTDPQMAMQVAQKAQDMKAQASKLGLEQARIKSLSAGVGKLNPQNYTAESWAKYAESGDLNDLKDKPGRAGTTTGPIGRISPKDFTAESIQKFLDSVQTGSPNYDLLERVKVEEKPLPASLVKDVGLITRDLTKLESSVSKIDEVGTLIGNLDLGLIQNYARGAAAWAGINTKDRVAFDATRRTALNEANNLLLLAKGTQTEGDAQRARDQIADDNTWKNKEALQAAFTDLKKAHEDTRKALQNQKDTLISYGSTPTSKVKQQPTAPAPTPPAGNEAMIQKFMAANPGKSREAVMNFMKTKGYLK
jgi:hypothetical protein